MVNWTHNIVSRIQGDRCKTDDVMRICLLAVNILSSRRRRAIRFYKTKTFFPELTKVGANYNFKTTPFVILNIVFVPNLRANAGEFFQICYYFWFNNNRFFFRKTRVFPFKVLLKRGKLIFPKTLITWER